MAKLNTCSTCEGKLSSNAKFCPSCGETNIGKNSFLGKLKRAFLWSIVLFAVLGYVINYISNIDVSHTVTNTKIKPPKKIYKSVENLEIKKNAILEILKSDKEPKVRDAMWLNDRILRVAVVDDKSNRNGFAEYLCLLLNDNGLKGNDTYITIVDFAKIIQMKEFVKIGETHCN